MGYGYYHNQYVGARRVQCPECGHEMTAKHEIAQCTVKDCRHRFVGDDYPVKTSDDVLREHREIFEALEEMESRFRKEITTIQTLKQKLKPLTKPKIRENKPEPIQETVTQ